MGSDLTLANYANTRAMEILLDRESKNRKRIENIILKLERKMTRLLDEDPCPINAAEIEILKWVLETVNEK